MLSWTFRIVGVCLAAVELVLLAMNGLGFHFAVPFENFMAWLGDGIAKTLRLDLAEAIIRQILSVFAIVLPKLGKHWEQVFVLIWLLLSRFALLVSYGTNLSYSIFVFLWAGICALFTAVAAGTAPIDSPAVFAWPSAGFILFVAGWVMSMGRPRGLVDWLGYVFYAALAALCVYGGYAGTTPWKPIIEVQSPGLLGLAALVGSIGLGALAWGLLFGILLDEPKNEFTSVGLDIVGAYSIAIALAFLGTYVMM